MPCSTLNPNIHTTLYLPRKLARLEVIHSAPIGHVLFSCPALSSLDNTPAKTHDIYNKNIEKLSL